MTLNLFVASPEGLEEEIAPTIDTEPEKLDEDGMPLTPDDDEELDIPVDEA